MQLEKNRILALGGVLALVAGCGLSLWRWDPERSRVVVAGEAEAFSAPSAELQPAQPMESIEVPRRVAEASSSGPSKPQGRPIPKRAFGSFQREAPGPDVEQLVFTGRAFGFHGEPLSGVSVRVDRIRPKLTMTRGPEAATDEEGGFSVACGACPDIKRDTEYRVSLRTREGLADVMVVVPSGVCQRDGIELWIEPGQRFSGWLTLADGLPVANAKFEVVELGVVSPILRQWVETDETGYYEFGLPQGTKALQATGLGLDLELRDVVQVLPLYEVESIVLDRFGSPILHSAQPSSSAAFYSKRRGVHYLEELPATVLVSVGERSLELNVEEEDFYLGRLTRRLRLHEQLELVR